MYLFVGAEMDLFALVQVADPTSVTVRTRELLPGETPILQATAGRVLDLVLENESSEEAPTNPIHATPINVAAPREEARGAEGSGSSASIQLVDVVNVSADTTAVTIAPGAEDRKRKRVLVEDDGATTSHVKRAAISTSGDIPDQGVADKVVAPVSEPMAQADAAVVASTEVAKTPPPT